MYRMIVVPLIDFQLTDVQLYGEVLHQVERVMFTVLYFANADRASDTPCLSQLQTLHLFAAN